MNVAAQVPLRDLYEKDETAWLEAMSKLAAEGRCAEFDLPNLSEFLDSMAKRDRREVTSRLVALLAHRLKWEHQPTHRSGSWRNTIQTQRDELADLLESRTLHSHALATLSMAYRRARTQASNETGFAMDAFPEACPWPFEDVLSIESLS